MSNMAQRQEGNAGSEFSRRGIPCRVRQISNPLDIVKICPNGTWRARSRRFDRDGILLMVFAGNRKNCGMRRRNIAKFLPANRMTVLPHRGLACTHAFRLQQRLVQ